jgi:hypothetical protein
MARPDRLTMTADLTSGWRIAPETSPADSAAWPERPPEIATPTNAARAWQHALGVDFKGVAWYFRELQLQRGEHDRLWLRFHAAATDLTAWINGAEVGHHCGDWTPFDLECTRSADAGPSTQTLAVRVDEMHAPRPAKGVLTENGHITKGFHDVLSLQHGGLWDRVELKRTGRIAIIPAGIGVVTLDHNPPTIRVRVDLHPHASRGRCEIRVADSRDRSLANASLDIPPGATRAEAAFAVPDAAPWSPESPTLYTLDATISDEHGLSDAASLRFGVRTVSHNGTHILLNGQPTMLRGVLHWGHEPRTISPTPSDETVRREFEFLRDAGFNCVCLCMWYPPRRYFEIADETGMLIWQEHPVWKSRMEDEWISEYDRLLRAYMRRDRSHPSVVLVSGACEHERINPKLARLWWAAARDEMPDRLLQVQTAFMAWTNPDQTDLHDEHVYENACRWPAFLRDAQEEIERVGRKPFVMGETIIGASWLPADIVAESGAADPKTLPWWVSKGAAECLAFERVIETKYGADVLARFRAHGDAFNLEHRRWQSEAFRSVEGNAGWVMNHIRDVAVCRCGFMDDRDRWRFPASQLRPWLGDRAVLLHTPQFRRAFHAGASVPASFDLSNFGAPIDDALLQLSFPGGGAAVESGKVPRGSIAKYPFQIGVSNASEPTRVPVKARLTSGDVPLAENSWNLWAFPDFTESPPDVVRLDGLPFTMADQVPQWEERAYSSGWGLKAASWKPSLPDLSEVLFKCPLWRFDAPLPRGTRVILAHKLTRSILDFISAGGRCILLASRTSGGMRAGNIMLWGQTPLIIEQGPLRAGDASWVIDLLHYDLNLSHARAIASEDLGIAASLDPIIRLVFTHDSGKPKLFDQLAWTRIDAGLLMVSSLDHREPAGRFLLGRMIATMLEAKPDACAASIPRAAIDAFTIEREG